jgi:hypothetical protein
MIDASVMEEAIRRMQLLVTGACERSELHPLEIAHAAAWVLGSADRAAAVLYVAVQGFATADAEDAAWVFAALRRKFVEG